VFLHQKSTTQYNVYYVIWCDIVLHTATHINKLVLVHAYFIYVVNIPITKEIKCTNEGAGKTLRIYWDTYITKAPLKHKYTFWY
jgi:hypothetical protein